MRRRHRSCRAASKTSRRREAQAIRGSVRGLKTARRWVEAGGCLAVFPAGEVSHLQLETAAIADPAWSPSIARLARRAGAAIAAGPFRRRQRRAVPARRPGAPAPADGPPPARAAATPGDVVGGAGRPPGEGTGRAARCATPSTATTGTCSCWHARRSRRAPAPIACGLTDEIVAEHGETGCTRRRCSATTGGFSIASRRRSNWDDRSCGPSTSATTRRCCSCGRASAASSSPVRATAACSGR